MKNKIFAFSLLLAAGALAGCNNEEDDLFSQSAAERLNAAQEKYSSILTSSAGGWAMEYYCTNDTVGENGATDYRAVGYLLGAKFNANGTVDMGMNNVFSGNSYISASSLWDINTDNGPVLSFDSNNPVIHSFSNPDNLPGSITGGDNVQGLGAEGDFEFVLTDVVADEELATIKGKKRGTYVRMTRLPQGTNFAQYIAECDSFRNAIFGSSNISEPVMRIGNSALCINTTAKTNVAKIYPYEGDSILTMYRRPFLITKRDGQFYLRFKADFAVAPDTSCQEFVYNDQTQSFTGVGEGKEGYTISGYPTAHFVQKVLNASHPLRFTTSSEMSDAVRSALQAVITNFNRRRFTFQNITLQPQSDGSLVYRIAWRQNRSNTARTYSATVQVTGDDELTVNFVGETNAAGEQLLSVVPEVRTLFETLSGSFRVSAPISPYNLSRVRFTSTANSDVWYEWTY